MPVYLVSLSQKVLYEEFIEAESEDLAIQEAAKIRRRPKQVATYEFSIDAIEEWDASLEGIDILHANP